MLLEMCKSKIHRARLTHCDLDYEGSLEIDIAYLEKANMLPYEKILVVNATNGERLETYAIPGERGSGVFRLNGAAARCVSVGDKVILMAYAQLTPEEVKSGYAPQVVFVDEENKIVRTTTYEKHGLLKDMA